MGRPISPKFWVGPKKLAQQYNRAFLGQANLVHTKMGPGQPIGLQTDPLLLFNLIFAKKSIF